MPDGWSFGRVSAVATDSSGDVYVFHRGDVADPIVVFNAEGTYQRSFGADMDFGNEHGLRIDRHDNVWVTDNGNHRVMKLSKEGEMLMSLGVKGEAGTTDETFDRPADIAFGPNDELYVADGYGIHLMWVTWPLGLVRDNRKCGLSAISQIRAHRSRWRGLRSQPVPKLTSW